eukprot:12399383-Karenia_brevis.AAC.1
MASGSPRQLGTGAGLRHLRHCSPQHLLAQAPPESESFGSSRQLLEPQTGNSYQQIRQLEPLNSKMCCPHWPLFAACGWAETWLGPHGGAYGETLLIDYGSGVNSVSEVGCSI